MNKTFEQNSNYASNSGITGAFPFLPEEVGSATQKATFSLASLLSFFASAKVRAIAKALAFCACLIGLVGIIGAMEAGSLRMSYGVIAGFALIGIEYLCLRPRRSAKTDSTDETL